MLIDGVFSGGGIKGFAFLGALQVLEKGNYQFRRVAGTSAGSIVAAFIAAGYTAKEMEMLFNELNLKSLLDPRKLAKKIPFFKWINLYFQGGLYKGKELEKWLSKKLAAKGIYTFDDLPKDSLKLVTSDLTNGRMIVIPDDLKDYGINWKKFSVAKALRMSCGIPFFFEPIKIKNGKREFYFVDGGVLSNFPVWIFDNKKKERPILGLKLSQPYEEMKPHDIKNGLTLFESLFSTMSSAHDRRYVSKKHVKNIIFIPIEDYSATQFNIDEETKQKLMEIGKNQTEKFLETWKASL